MAKGKKVTVRIECPYCVPKTPNIDPMEKGETFTEFCPKCKGTGYIKK